MRQGLGKDDSSELSLMAEDQVQSELGPLNFADDNDFDASR
ncbi:MAG: hypothetical protein ACPIOQ_14225 [Promethearchaeia archaeon]